jgi:HlyD family secretion protein
MQVAADEVLATLQNRARAEAEVAAARAALELAERQLEQVRKPWRDATLRALTAAIESRRADLDLAQQQMRRTAELQRAGVRANAERDTREAEQRRAASLLREAEAQLAAATDISEREVRVAEAEVTLAGARLTAATAEAELSLIRAPRSGTVLHVHAHSGEQIGGRTILELADMTRLKAVAEVDERLLPQIRLGARARVTPRGAAREWPGVVARIGGVVRVADRAPGEAATGRGGRFVEVEVTLPDLTDLPLVAGLELAIRLDPP